jgi:hypothetical protein
MNQGSTHNEHLHTIVWIGHTTENLSGIADLHFMRTFSLINCLGIKSYPGCPMLLNGCVLVKMLLSLS